MFNRPVIGIDVAKEFCVYAAVSPTGCPYEKPFKKYNTKKGLLAALDIIKKVAHAFQSDPAIALESTGHYSQRIVHFFLKRGFEVYHINPLVSHSIKNSLVRKVKTDRLDALELARLLFVHSFRPTVLPSEPLANLKVLARTRGQLVKQRNHFCNQLQGAIEQIAPLLPKVFCPGSLTALTLLSTFPTPADWLNKANQAAIVTVLETVPRQGKSYAQKKYADLLACAEDAQVTGIPLAAYAITIQRYTALILAVDEQIKELEKQIQVLSHSITAVRLLQSIPGIGETLAAVLVGEIGEVSRFASAKQLVAFSGIDPSVKQSGHFVGTRNKVTKRGSPFLRHALYLAATTSVRKAIKGTQVNPVIYEYYQRKIKSKTKKQALGAVMNKLVRMMYSVLKNQRPFRLISPEEQIQLYREQTLKKPA